MSFPFKVKVVCSCIRNGAISGSLYSGSLRLTDRLEQPEEGDIVLVRALDRSGLYTEVENEFGRGVRVYEGDVFAGVLGSRNSGTNATGHIRVGPISSGRKLSLLAAGGLIGELLGLPGMGRSDALRVSVVGFPLGSKGKTLTIRRKPRKLPRQGQEDRLLFVAGTSAEVGKTTVVCGILRALRNMKAGAIKIAGTGRLKDILRFKDAGASYFKDFVDLGWPSTYEMPDIAFSSVLDELVSGAPEDLQVLAVEIGGDLLAGGAQLALNYARQFNSPFILCVNDAMAAVTGLKILHDYGIDRVAIGSFKQNVDALSRRLNLQDVFYISADHDVLADTLSLRFPKMLGLESAKDTREHRSSLGGAVRAHGEKHCVERT